MVFIITFVMLLAIFFMFRVPPIYLSRNAGRVDHWFWKNYIETYRRTRQFPPFLKEYILEKDQWYPPVFPLFMAWLPKMVFDRHSSMLAIVLDLMRFAVLLVVAYLLTGSAIAVGIAGVAYALTPILSTYNVQLNPRGLGALFLDLLVVLVLWIEVYHASGWLWIPVLLLSGLVLMTHKMTTQVFWFLCLGGGLLSGDVKFLLLIPASMVTAMIVSRGFYWNVLKAHVDIVAFWNRNWWGLGAHPLKTSPIYGEEAAMPDGVHAASVVQVTKKVARLVVYCPWAWIAPLVYWLRPHAPVALHHTAEWVMMWLLCILFFSLVTTLFRLFYCVGQGYLYLYNAAFPAAILVALTLTGSQPFQLPSLLFACAVLASLAVIAVFFRRMKATNMSDEDLGPACRRLGESPRGVVLCFPYQLFEPVAYLSRQPVLWGAHSNDFVRLEPILPHVKVSLAQLQKDYEVRYVFMRTDYVPDSFIRDIKAEAFLDFGPYRLYTLTDL